jgi:hypothetical protein
VVDDLSALTLRELIALARQRLGPGASSLKTRAEFLAALAAPAGAAPGPVAPAAPRVERETAPAPAAAVPAPPRPAVVTRDFFVARRA